ncbi:hypothetical protein MN608_08567 [Microdochium nivale]|nr:hypothetical protein MN608_08567 [Microdochium nivale]
MVNFISALSVAFGLVAVASALPAASSGASIILESRDVSCLDNLGQGSLARQNEAAECINYLASLGNQACVSSVNAVSFCRRGETQITGISKTGHNGATSSCQNVARAAGAIMDRCSRGDGTVRGQNEAWGNGNLLVDIRRVR